MGNIVHSSLDENGCSHGGSAGDQTGKEVYIRTWYEGNWTCMIRCTDSSLAKKAAVVGMKLANSNLVGHNQVTRNTLYRSLSLHNWNVDEYISSGEKTECDCSSFIWACYCCVIPSLRQDGSSPTTSSLPIKLLKSKFKLYVDNKFLTNESNLEVGDILDSEGSHVVMYTGDATEISQSFVTFTPRLSAPSASDKYWIHTTFSGYNECIICGPNGSTIPNCVGYAWGRFLEILRTKDSSARCNLCRGNAGTWFNHTEDGYQRGDIPQVGAVMCWDKFGGAGHVCIVEKVNPDGSVTTSESGYKTTRWWSQVRSGSNWGAPESTHRFQGFIYNPAAEGSVEISSSYNGVAFDHLNDRNDAIVREIGYLSNNTEPSIKMSDIKLSLINVTPVLANLIGNNTDTQTITVDDSGQVVSDDSQITYSLDTLESKKKEVINFLTDKGLNLAASVGILANIIHESNIRTDAVGDHGTSFGICQWHLGRGDRMKSYVGTNWSNNLTGQLNFLWSELTTGYSSVLSSIQAVSNTLNGCKQAADIFVRRFEMPSNIDKESSSRQATAQDIWNSCNVKSKEVTQ